MRRLRRPPCERALHSSQACSSWPRPCVQSATSQAPLSCPCCFQPALLSAFVCRCLELWWAARPASPCLAPPCLHFITACHLQTLSCDVTLDFTLCPAVCPGHCLCRALSSFTLFPCPAAHFCRFPQSISCAPCLHFLTWALSIPAGTCHVTPQFSGPCHATPQFSARPPGPLVEPCTSSQTCCLSGCLPAAACCATLQIFPCLVRLPLMRRSALMQQPL